MQCVKAHFLSRNLNADCCNLDLSDQQEDDVVAFLKTLTDGYMKK